MFITAPSRPRRSFCSGFHMAVGLALLPAVSAATPVTTTQNGQWQVQESASAIDNTHSYAATLLSDDTVTDLIGQPKPATLGFICHSKGLFLSLIWPDFVDNPFRSFHLRVVARSDAAPPESDSWVAMDQGLAKPGDEAKAWLNAHAKVHKLVVRVPDRHGGQEATFTLDGLEPIAAKLNAMSCG